MKYLEINLKGNTQNLYRENIKLSRIRSGGLSFEASLGK
jgi:hypothetical protein